MSYQRPLAPSKEVPWLGLVYSIVELVMECRASSLNLETLVGEWKQLWAFRGVVTFPFLHVVGLVND